MPQSERQGAHFLDRINTSPGTQQRADHLPVPVESCAVKGQAAILQHHWTRAQQISTAPTELYS
jgi:hypothetical protein